ncbi:LA2681 family HEPN domain-containing protein [Pseudoalteromonas galatheae]|uniref:LA2681 family HEPN domain-containing protein n=1 Tax=Pseudoalteromonas galatheae TaxID=579562 RepID=UPI0030CB5F49
MDLKTIEAELKRLYQAVSVCEFEEARNGAKSLYSQVHDDIEKSPVFYLVISNIAGILIDLEHMKPCPSSSQDGLNILVDHKDGIIEQIGEAAYYYNLSNAKSNLVKVKNPFEHSFSSIEQLVEVKTDLWKAVNLDKFSSKSHVDPTYIVNLGNSLKQQFRITEALECYDLVNSLNLDIPQSWVNRSATLLMLNTVSKSYTIEMLEQIKRGYENVLLSNEVPPIWMEHYKGQVDFHQNKINQIVKQSGIEQVLHDNDKTREEYERLSDYRRFCLDNNLSLSEHALYCPCVASSRDNLTILTSDGIAGEFVIPMEMVLNRLKSEFSFARHLYFEYLTSDIDHELLHDSCFSELLNDELLGVEVEKLRTAFRTCFGILDKIAVAICELLDASPKNKNIYFQNFWRLDQEERRELFNKHKCPGLLALYSIATDLNKNKNGEWSFLKQLRNDLEHEFVVVHKSEEPNDVYSSYQYMENIVFVKEELFIEHLKRLLQLTRSAIFSFVFTVRDKALSEIIDEDVAIPKRIYPQDLVTDPNK